MLSDVICKCISNKRSHRDVEHEVNSNNESTLAATISTHVTNHTTDADKQSHPTYNDIDSDPFKCPFFKRYRSEKYRNSHKKVAACKSFDDAIHFFELRMDLSEKATQNRKKRAVRKWKDILPLILSITGGDLLEAKEIINIGDEFITACLKGENSTCVAEGTSEGAANGRRRDSEDNREDDREDNNGDLLNYNSSHLLSEGTLTTEFKHSLSMMER